MPTFRFDRVLTLYLFHPLVRNAKKSRSKIPILMYHSISDRDEDARHPYYLTNTRPEIFDRQMQFLADNNYKVISLGEAMSLLSNEANPESRVLSSESGLIIPNPESRIPNPSDHNYVVITFDDGYRDFYTAAFQTLKKHGYDATVYLTAGCVGTGSVNEQGRGYLSWDEVSLLKKAGIRIGSHTMTHPQLRDFGRLDVEREVTESKRVIEEKLGEPIDSFAYPYAFPEVDGSFTAGLRTMLQAAGYRNGVTTVLGRASADDDPYFLKRIPINSLDDIPLFRAKLEGGYDWMHALQFASKSLKSKRKASCQS